MCWSLGYSWVYRCFYIILSFTVRLPSVQREPWLIFISCNTGPFFCFQTHPYTSQVTLKCNGRCWNPHRGVTPRACWAFGILHSSVWVSEAPLRRGHVGEAHGPLNTPFYCYELYLPLTQLNHQIAQAFLVIPLGFIEVLKWTGVGI